jgi:outer membrane protein assembly factor BamB
MKKSKYLLTTVAIAFVLLISSCAMGPRAVGTPGLSVDEDMVYVAYQQFMYAVDASSGIGAIQSWKYPSQGSTNVVFYAPPEVTEDGVYVGDLANTFHKLDKENGVEIWSLSEAKGWFIGQAKVKDEIILAQSSDRTLYALTSNGSIKWQFANEYAFWAQPVVDEGRVYLGSMDHKLYALDLDSGDLIWEKELKGAVVSAPIFDANLNRLYVGTLGREMVALDIKDGEEVWSYPAGDSISSIWTTPILHDGQVIFVDETGKIFSLDTQKGELLWNADAGGDVMAGLLALDDSFLVALESGMVLGYSYEGARTSLFFQVDGEVYTTPVNANGTIVVAAINGDSLLYGYDLEGKQVFSFKSGN